MEHATERNGFFHSIRFGRLPHDCRDHLRSILARRYLASGPGQARLATHARLLGSLPVWVGTDRSVIKAIAGLDHGLVHLGLRPRWSQTITNPPRLAPCGSAPRQRGAWMDQRMIEAIGGVDHRFVHRGPMRSCGRLGGG